MKKIFSLSLALGTAVSVYAANAGVPSDTVQLNEILISAPLKSSPALLPLDVTQVTQEEIEKSGETSLLPVLVSKVPGLFVTERGFAGYGVSGGAAGTVNIRGVGQGNKVLFMIDGQPQWAGVFGHALSDTYVANGVEKIEVVKGPSSLLYGSNAMGGSINLITNRQKSDGITGRESFRHRSPDNSTGATAIGKGAPSGLQMSFCNSTTRLPPTGPWEEFST